MDPTILRKGRLVEKIVEWLYEGLPNATVTAREFLPTLDGLRECEIDVLITSRFGGVEIRTPVECKNEERPVSKRHMEHFVNKLEAVGIPTSLGLFVSATRYTSGALKIAQEAGVRPLLVGNLTSDRLASQVAEVIQTIVFLRASVSSMNLVDTSTRAFQTAEEYGLYDEEDRYAGTLLDHIWSGWVAGAISLEPGQHVVQIELPAGWHRRSGDLRYEINAVGAVIQVDGLILNVRGTAKAHALEDVGEGTIHRFRQEASFDVPAEGQILRVLSNRADLVKYLEELAPWVVLYSKLPRIVYGAAYWPPSDRVVDVVKQHVGQPSPGEMPEALSLQFEELEGSNVLGAWEPIAHDYFASQSDGRTGPGQITFHDYVAPSVDT
jgi:hypothetical protein